MTHGGSFEVFLARASARAASAGAGKLAITLPKGLQGLPDTAHGGTVIALFDTLGAVAAPRALSAHYRRRVPLELPLELTSEAGVAGTIFELRDDRGVLVDGGVTGGDPPVPASHELPAEAVITDRMVSPSAGADLRALPVSSTCFVCGIDNEVGLRAALTFDARHVTVVYPVPHAFRRRDGAVSPAVVTSLLDETAFWLGALATGEAGMTTELRIAVHVPVIHGEVIIVSGPRDRVVPHETDGRYWRTVARAHDGHGQVVATARISFVAVRGAAKKLASGFLSLNPPDVVRSVFPTYA